MERERDSYATRRVNKVLQDIDEARGFGIKLHKCLTLNDLYTYLQDAREQSAEHYKRDPGGNFVYDPMESQQPADDDGLDQLSKRVQAQRRRRSRSKKRSSRKGSRRKKQRVQAGRV